MITHRILSLLLVVMFGIAVLGVTISMAAKIIEAPLSPVMWLGGLAVCVGWFALVVIYYWAARESNE